MPSKAVLVSCVLCCIIQVVLIPCVSGSYGHSTTILVRILLKSSSINSTSILGPKECDAVPTVANLVLQATLTEITANWSQPDSKCFPDVRFRITTAGVDGIVSQNHLNISGLACHTSYDVKVSPVNAAGAEYGVSMNATIVTKGVPKVVALILQATLNEITAKWSLSDPDCFPDVRFRVTTAGVDEIISQNPHNISGLSCDTSYNVKVSPVNADGADYGVSTNATIITKGVVVNLIAMVAASLVAKWTPVRGSCQNFARYEVTLSTLNGSSKITNITESTHFVFSPLNFSTAYQVRVQPLNGSGQAIGQASMANQTTIVGTAAERCPFPSLEYYTHAHHRECTVVDIPAPGTNLQANRACYLQHRSAKYSASLYFSQQAAKPFEELQEYLRIFNYKKELLVNAYSKNGEWVWGFGVNYNQTFPINPSLLTGIPAGGDGPDDFTMLFLDPAKNFGLSATKNRSSFGGMICTFALMI